MICNREEPVSAVGIGKHGWNAGHDVYFFPPRGRSQVKWQFLQIAFSVLYLCFFPLLLSSALIPCPDSQEPSDTLHCSALYNLFRKTLLHILEGSGLEHRP